LQAVSQLRTYATQAEVNNIPVEIHNDKGKHRVVVTKNLPGDRWLKVLTSAGCRVEICKSQDTILSNETIKTLLADRPTKGVLGQLTEDWGEELFTALEKAGGRVYSNYAVGYNNVDTEAATRHNIAVGNTPGVLTETTAELALALTFAAARRVVEADRFMRAGQYKGWLPDLFVGNLLQGKTVGIIGAGRIGTAYARMMMEGHKMNVVYYDPFAQNKFLEQYGSTYNKVLDWAQEPRISVKRLATVEEVLQQADVVSLHCALTKETTHLMDKKRLGMMKKDAILVNAARGPVINEVDLVEHLKQNPDFRAGLDVFEDEPLMKPGLAECDNAVVVPHIASASLWTRAGMATLAACNVAAVINHKPMWKKPDILPFVDGPLDQGGAFEKNKTAFPAAAPGIVNAKELVEQESSKSEKEWKFPEFHESNTLNADI
jgi:hydroxypyruvate reductase 1